MEHKLRFETIEQRDLAAAILRYLQKSYTLKLGKKNSDLYFDSETDLNLALSGLEGFACSIPFWSSSSDQHSFQKQMEARG